MIHNIMKDLSDAQWAHGLARIGLGINIALHGWTRIPMIHEFAAGMRVKFEPSFLPVGLVGLSSYGIVIAESVIGAMLLAGWQMRGTLIAGHLLMFTLLFGACSVQDWGAAGMQMVYLAFFSVLLATRRHQALCVDPKY